MLNDLGGLEGLCGKLKTDPDNGVNPDPEEMEARTTVFGTNKKDKFKRTSKF